MPEKYQHNDPLEHFFRKKADEFDIPYREENWLKLEHQLNLANAAFRFRRRLYLVTAAAVLIISLLGYFTYENHNRLNEMAGVLNQAQTPSTLPDQLQPGEPDIPAGEDAANEVITENDTLRENSEETGETDPQPSVIHPFVAAAGNDHETNALPPITEVRELTRYERLPHQKIPADYLHPKIADAEILETNERFLHIPSGVQTDMPRGFVLAEARSQIESRHPEHAMMRDGFGEPATGKYSRFSAGFYVSPDLSSAGSFSGSYDPGYKIGLAGEYKLARNLSVSAGLVFSDVRYTASGGNYAPSGYNPAPPDEAAAVCLILDIPFTMKYNIIHFENSRFYATAGLSSYMMLNEDYRFSYADGGEGLPQQLSIRNGSRHWLSNAGFSAGFELDIHPLWSLRAEPFIKIPIREVGWGNVELYSMGGFVSLNYRFPEW